MLVGANGSGKSTFYNQMLKPLGLPFINADLIAKELFPENPEANSYLASKIAEQMRYDQLAVGESFCFETVFSHPSKIDFIAKAKALGYEIILIFIHVGDSALNLARIHQRVLDGGHDVPEDKVLSRIPRLLENLNKAMALCDEVRMLDNSSLDAPFMPVLTIKQGQRIRHLKPLPDWASQF